MNVTIHDYPPSIDISRIEHKLRKYAPANVEWTDLQNAELVIIPVIGRHDHITRFVDTITKSGRKYVVLQVSLKSTRNPNPADWLELWQGAVMVWSYYWLPGKFHLYHAPLGADPLLFHPLNLERKYVVGMTGQYTRTECLWELEKAARSIDEKALKIHAENDEQMNVQYNQCRYISGLRHKEGFELPAAEGMLAGARPILFDTPDFRYWYDGIAEFIPEGNPLSTINHLTRLFQLDFPVSGHEVMYARYRFDWERIISRFWERCL
jgi:hypothetical protein